MINIINKLANRIVNKKISKKGVNNYLFDYYQIIEKNFVQKRIVCKSLGLFVEVKKGIIELIDKLINKGDIKLINRIR